LVFSFADIENIYRKVQNNLKRENIPYIEFTKDSMIEIAEGLVKIRVRWKSDGWNISLATCAEQIDLEQYNIKHNHCIDGELMKQIFSDNADLMHYLSYGKLPDRNPLFPDEIPNKSVNLKDKGQRKICGCMISKDIGMYNTCSHFCVYCYANTSKETVEKNRKKFSTDSESIISQ
jgi:hypothetical protein